MNMHNFSHAAAINRPSSPLTMGELRHYAPSAFATEKFSDRSDRYAYLPTIDIITAMQNAGFLPYKATQSRSRSLDRREHTKHMIRFRSPMAEMQMAGQSIPEVVLINSHDGSSAYKLMLGIFRLVCSNGLVVADSMQASISVRHTGNIVDQVLEASHELAGHAPKVIDAIRDWTGLQLTSGEQQAYAEAAHTIRFADAEGKVDTPITAAQLLHLRRPEDTGTDLYSTMNRVQENVIKGGLHARSPRTRRMISTREVKGIDQDVKLNRALWQLSEKMAELKRA
jgi:hypothetical protein